MKSNNLLIISILLFLTATIQATLKLPTIISDNMVLQQNKEVNLWGWTTQPNEKVLIMPSWSTDTIIAKAIYGKWSAQIKTPAYGGPFTITFKSHETKIVNNVMIGEVWLASGQSNMEMTVDSTSYGFKGVVNYKTEIQNSKNSNIRMFTIPKAASDYPQEQCDGEWKESNPENVGNFSAVGYYFAKKLYESLGIPVGIICSSWGGTNAETWMSNELTTKNEEINKAYTKLLNPTKPWPMTAGVLYNAMIFPIEQYNIKGAIWYQGESNIKNAEVYEQVMTNLITSWRKNRGEDIPFYFTQIAPFTYKNQVSGAFLREAQLQTLKVPFTGMAVTNDIGNLDNIHPLQKQEVGQRLALWALAKDYNKVIAFSGPLYKSMSVDKNKIIIEFDYAKNGLMMKGKNLNCFEIAGGDNIFVAATAVIKGDKVIVSAKSIKQPLAVRFAFSDIAQPNLYNVEGLPASAFRTDNW